MGAPMTDDWFGLYRESWKGVIVDEAFQHPAKFSRALIQRIYEHVIEEGWASKGDSVIDPFGGVALGAFPAMQHGLNWFGCELEEKFVALGNQNIALWNERYSRMPNWGSARLAQGDSRKMVEVLSAADCCVSSPPYGCDSLHRAVNAEREEALPAADRMGKSAWGGGYGNSEGQLSNLPATIEGHGLAITSPPYVSGGHHNDIMGAWNANGRGQGVSKDQAGYGKTEGQLGAMPEGQLSISSPPFPQPYTGGGGINVKGYSNEAQRKGSSEKPFDLVGKRTYQGKGGVRTKGNLETLDLEGFDAAISSPPFMDQGRDDRRPQGGMKVDIAHRKKGVNGSPPGLSHFGDTEGQIGIMSAETFWSASRLILEQLHQVLSPNAHAVFVVKSFVRDKRIVDFPAQWAQLCEAVGFKLLHDHHALLTEHYGTQGGFDEDKKLSVERKSFFRRLAEAKGSPRIDYENVLCFVRLG